MGLLELEDCEELVGFRWESSELSKDWDARQDTKEIRNIIEYIYRIYIYIIPHNIEQLSVCFCTYPSRVGTLARKV